VDYLKGLVGLGVSGLVEFTYIDAPAAAVPCVYTGAAPPAMNATASALVKTK
jgi:hypothetical protein